ncbi:hypothetical protein EDD15DRAFT_1530222 [Pisolithus albus]|nr:hypothetical protein EDD15DRAFT_1530222 [Pisolithus albus]
MSLLPTTLRGACRRSLLSRVVSNAGCFSSAGRFPGGIPKQPLRGHMPLQLSLFRRLCTSSRVHQQESTPENGYLDSRSNRPVSYHGPLTQTFRRLKIFSLSSLALSCVMAPFIFIVESSLPMSARIVLAATALTTSGVSTALVGWSGAPYVVDLRRLTPAENGGIEGIEMTTLTLTLRKLTTRVYDADFLVDTKRPFAKWELAHQVQLPSPSEEPTTAAKAGAPGEVETVAETLNANNDVIGRWVVKWEAGGAGSCKAVGRVVRYFNVHQELL